MRSYAEVNFDASGVSTMPARIAKKPAGHPRSPEKVVHGVALRDLGTILRAGPVEDRGDAGHQLFRKYRCPRSALQLYQSSQANQNAATSQSAPKSAPRMSIQSSGRRTLPPSSVIAQPMINPSAMVNGQAE